MARWGFYLFFLASLLVALGLRFSDSETGTRIAPLFPALLGLSMLFLAQDRTRQGVIRGRHTHIYRSSHPIVFWSMLGVFYLCGAILLIAGGWLLLQS